MAALGGFLRDALRRCGLAAGVLVALLALPVLANPGLSWLATQQAPDGSYGPTQTSLATPVQATAEVLRAQWALEQGGTEGFASALDYLNARTGADTELLARQLAVNAQLELPAPNPVSTLLTRLHANQGSTGGFGARPGHAPSVFDTAVALEALAMATEPGSPQAAAAVSFLLSRQQSSGGWMDGANEPSVYLTAASMRALWSYRSIYEGVSAALTRAQNFLLSRRGADSLWGEDFQSASVLLALVPHVGDLSLVDASVAALQARQGANGSWAEDTFTTALALQALRAHESRQSGPAPIPSGAISGYVVRAHSTEPVAGATVMLEQLPEVAVLTNAEGYYAIPGLPAGSYTVSAGKTGYTSASTGVTVQGGQLALAGHLVLDVVSTTGLVRGRVFDEADGQALSGVQVSLGDMASNSVLTNGEGGFDFGAVAPGAYTLRFEKSGYLTLSGTATVVAGKTLSTQLGMRKAGGYADDSPGPVSGRVVDGKSGQPLASAVMDLGSGLSATTGTDGTFQLASVPRGTYQGTLSASGYQPASFSFIFSAGASGNMGTLPLYPQAVTTPPTSLTLRGLVAHGVSGAPLAGASVTLVETGASATTDSDGRFMLAGITLKSFKLAVAAAGYTPATYDLNVSAYGEAEVTLKLSPPGNGATSSQLAGLVTNAESGEPIAGAQVSISGTSLVATSGSDGHFSLSGIGQLEFNVSVSAVGYTQRLLGVKLGAHGSYPLNPTLQPVPGESFQIVAVSAQQPEWGANATALFTVRVASLLSASQSALVLGEVQDATGSAVATVRPYAEATTTPASEFTFAPGEVKQLTLAWSTGQFAPGRYRLVVRVSQPGTLTRAAPFGEVLAEGATQTRLVASSAISGAMAINPPLTQAGHPTPVSFSALVRNAGNTPLPARPYVLTVLSEKTGAPLFTAEVTGEALAVGTHTQVSFGSWVPSEAGNLPVIVRPRDTTLPGQLTGRLYVGDKASGTFTVNRTVVPEGTQTVRGTIAMQGVDTTQGGSTDPIFSLVKEAVRRGGVYTAQQSVVWNESNRCLGCHVQTQSLLGLSSSVGKAEIDSKATQYLYNTIATSQWADGALRISHPEFTKSQTALGLWSLGAWSDMAGSFRIKYRAAQYHQARKVRSGDKTSWQADYNGGWWGSTLGQTMLVVKGYVDTLKAAQQLPPAGEADYSLSAGRAIGKTWDRPEGMAVGPDGQLYVAKYYGGVITRMNLETGAVSTFASNLPSGLYGLAFDSAGTMYVTRNASTGAVIKLLPNGTRTPLPVGGNLVDVVTGADGWLYLSDWTANRILRLNPATNAVETVASGGLISRPYGLAFDAEGNLLVANNTGYNVLKITLPSRQVTPFASGLAYRPMRLTVAADGNVYLTTENFFGLIRVRPDGVGERILETSQSLLGVLAHGDKLYVSNDSTGKLQELQVGTLDTAGLTAMRDELPYAARYLLSYTDASTDNISHALRIIGLAEARSVLTDQALLAQIDARVTSTAQLLRSRQKADGGWPSYSTTATSDPLTTAMVGIALEYTNPSSSDPQIRKAIQYLLNKQRPDGSWDSLGNGLNTRLSATSFVMIFMPKALDRLGGIDVDLHVELPSNIQLANPSTSPTQSQPGASGTVSHLWKLPGVTGAGREVAFDLRLLDMALGEQRPVATRAYLEFKNSFVDERVRLPLEIPVVHTSSGATLAVATDKGQYLAEEPVAITSTVMNTSQVTASGQVALALRAVGGTEPFASLPSMPFSGLAPGAQRAFTASWNTGATLAGSYEVHARLLDTQGRVLAEDVTPFDIDTPAAVASSTLGTDRPTYDAWDTVYLTGHVLNVATNTTLAPTRVELTVKSPVGETLLEAERGVSELAPGGHFRLPFSLTLSDAASGTYPVTLVLQDAFTRQVLHTRTTHFEVVRRAIQSLTGTASVQLPLVHQGDMNVCGDQTQVAGAGPVPGVTLIHRLLKMDSGEVLDEATETVDLPSSGLQHVYSRTIATEGLELGGYACVLEALVDGEARTLASVGFRVIEPPIKVAAQLTLGGRGRLLVLVDPASLGADPHGPEQAPSLASQRALLEQLLTDAGWSYTLTETASGFARELRTGGYVAYALFSEQVKLDTQTQKELREAVFRGEGLLVAGAHDSRNHGQYEPLGVKFIGHHGQAAAVQLGSPEFPLLSGQFALLPSEKPERIERTGAETLGTYGQAGPEAVTLHTYGLGEAAFSGADLLAIATRDGQSDVAADLLRVLLERVHPESLATAPGAVVPVQLSVTNQGIAVPVTATVVLPAGVGVVDAGTGAVSGQTVTFSFPLGVDEVKTVRLWVKLPQASGQVTLQAVVQAGQGNQTVSVPAEVVLPLSQVDDLEALQARLEAWVGAGHPEAKALGKASHFVGKALSSADRAGAIREVLQAADVLVGRSHPDVVDLRVALGTWLRWASLDTN